LSFGKGKGKGKGKNAGGLISNLLKAKSGNVAIARSVIEQASTKQNPREWVSAATKVPSAQAPPSDRAFGHRLEEF